MKTVRDLLGESSGDLRSTFGDRWSEIAQEFLFGVGHFLSVYLSDKGYAADSPDVAAGRGMFLAFEGDATLPVLRGSFHVWIGTEGNKLFPNLDVKLNPKWEGETETGKKLVNGAQKTNPRVWGRSVLNFTPQAAAELILGSGGLGDVLGIYDF